jgi:hypothetical protein
MQVWLKKHHVVCVALVYVLFQLFLVRHWHTTCENDKTISHMFSFPSIESPTTSDILSLLSHIDLEEEIQKGLEYVQSIQDIQRHLKFVHIPKAAGSALEEVAGIQAQINWGSCLFNHRPKRRGNICRYPPGQFEWPTLVGWWHLPPNMFPLMGTNPYDHADLFVVVRDVSERLLSEFHYLCRKPKNKSWDTDVVECNARRMHQATYLNEWLQFRLNRTTTRQLTTAAPDYYLYYNGHFTPQYDFVVSPLSVRMVDYVIRMDKMKEEFPALMQAYGLDIQLPTNKINAARHHSIDLQVNSIDSNVQALIRETYRDDWVFWK